MNLWTTQVDLWISLLTLVEKFMDKVENLGKKSLKEQQPVDKYLDKLQISL